MFYISNLNGVQAPFYSSKIEKTSLTKTEKINPVENYGSNNFKRNLNKELSSKNHYEEIKEKSEIKRRVPIVAIDIMSAPVVTLNQEEIIKEAINIFSTKRYRHIPVVGNANILVGILSDRDVFRAEDKSIKVKDIMSQNILTARPEATIRSIVRVLIEERIGCIPIVSQNNEFKGIITRTDILRTLVKDAPLDLVF